jgi:hypothetical protein
MARRARGRKTQRRRRKQGISLINTAESIMLANVATQTLFNVNALEFITGNAKGMTASGVNAISLRELFKTTQTGSTALGIAGSGKTTDIIQKNLKDNWVTGSISMVTIPLGFKLGKALSKPAISKINSALRKAGIASTVRL